MGAAHAAVQRQAASTGSQPGRLRQALHRNLLPVLIALAFFLLYAITAAPSIVELFDDSLEFQLVLPTLQIAHPTGYPLYTLVGALWCRILLPFGNWAWRINLLSALAGGIAVGLTAALAQRLAAPAGGKRARWAAGIAAAVAFGLGPVWWSQTTVAEVYALHNLLLAAALLAAVRIPGCAQERLGRRMGWLGLWIGLGLAHHRTMALAVPAILLYLLWAEPRLRGLRRAWLWWLVALAAPLLLYLYLPLRSAMGAGDLHGSYRNTWSGFLDHVLARGYTGFFSNAALQVQRSPGDWLALGLAQLGWAGWLLAAVGCLWLADRRVRQGWVLVLLVLAINLVFTLNYHVGDQQVFLLPAFLCAALLAGGGAAWLMARAPGRWAWAIGAAALLLLALGPGRGPGVNRSGEWAAHDYATDLATVAYPPGSKVIGLEGETTALKYMQQATGLAPRVATVTADLPEQRRQALAEAVAAGEPVFLTREVEGIGDKYSFSGDGPLVRVWPRGQAQAGAPQHPLAVSMADGKMRLEGYDLQRLDWAGGPALRLALYWRPTTQLTQTLKVSVRLLDATGAPLRQADGSPAVLDELPLRQVARTGEWLPQELVRDVHTLPAPAAVLAQPFTLQVILYDADTVAEVGRWEAQQPALSP